MKTDRVFQMTPPCEEAAWLPSLKTSVALGQQQQQQQEQQNLHALDRSSVPASKKFRLEEGKGQSASAATVAEEGSSGVANNSNGNDEAGSGKLQGWAPPGLGVCQLWAQQASSLKRKKGALASTSFPPLPFSDASSLPAYTERQRHRASVAVGFGIDDAVPPTREDKAKLVGGYLGTSRPGYGDASRTPVWWPEEVPWLKGVSISQMNNATLHTLVLAVKSHQRQERRQALATGAELPDGLFAFTPKTKKEMSRLIRSIQGRRLEYGKEGKRPAWWPKNCPWDNHKPLSTMKHAEVTSVFKAMVREGLLSDADVNGASCRTAPPSASAKNTNDNGNDRAADSEGEDSGEATSDNYCQVSSGDGYGGRHMSASDISSERSSSGSSSFWDGDDDEGKVAVGNVIENTFSPLCETIDPDSAKDVPLYLSLPVQRGASGLMPSSKQQEHHLARQQQLQQQQQQRPLEQLHGGGLGLDVPPVASATAAFPGWSQPVGKFSSSSSSPSPLTKVGDCLEAGQAGKCSTSTVAPSVLESVHFSSAKLPPVAGPRTDEEGAWQGRTLFEDLLSGGLNGAQSCGLGLGFHGEEGSGGSAEKMFGFNPLDDDPVFAVGGQV
eukprot:g7004.t1